MTKQQEITIKRQIIVRMDENILAQQIVLAGILGNPEAYSVGKAEEHVDRITKTILDYRDRQHYLRVELKDLRAQVAAA